MPDIPILCMVCTKSIKESQFINHMNNVHGSASQSEAMARQGNVPQQAAPIVLDKEAPPSQDFLEVAKMLDEKIPEQPKPSPAVSKETQVSAITPQREKPKPLLLKYKWEGNCSIDNVPVRTIMTQVDGRIFATAYCLTHEDIEQTEVAPIPVKYSKVTENNLRQPETVVIDDDDHIEPTILTKKEVKKYGK